MGTVRQCRLLTTAYVSLEIVVTAKLMVHAVKHVQGSGQLSRWFCMILVHPEARDKVLSMI